MYIRPHRSTQTRLDVREDGMGKGQAAASRKTTEEDETTAQGTNTQDNESNTQTKHTHINMLATRRAAPTLARSLKSLSRLVRTPTYNSAPPQLNPLVNLLVTIGAPDSTGYTAVAVTSKCSRSRLRVRRRAAAPPPPQLSTPGVARTLFVAWLGFFVRHAGK